MESWLRHYGTSVYTSLCVRLAKTSYCGRIHPRRTVHTRGGIDSDPSRSTAVDCRSRVLDIRSPMSVQLTPKSRTPPLRRPVGTGDRLPDWTLTASRDDVERWSRCAPWQREDDVFHASTSAMSKYPVECSYLSASALFDNLYSSEYKNQ